MAPPPGDGGAGGEPGPLEVAQQLPRVVRLRLAAFLYEKFAAWTYTGGEPERALTQDEMLDDISLYWFTNTAASAARFYWENNANNFNAVSVSIPAAVTVFPGEIYRAPRSWTERSYHQLIYFNETDRGGHFAAWEEPDLFTAEIRAAFRPLRPANSSTKERSL